MTNSCEFFTPCEEFVRIIHTCDKDEVWILRFNIAAIIIMMQADTVIKSASDSVSIV